MKQKVQCAICSSHHDYYDSCNCTRNRKHLLHLCNLKKKTFPLHARCPRRGNRSKNVSVYIYYLDLIDCPFDLDGCYPLFSAHHDLFNISGSIKRYFGRQYYRLILKANPYREGFMSLVECHHEASYFSFTGVNHMAPSIVAANQVVRISSRDVVPVSDNDQVVQIVMKTFKIK